MKSFCLLTMRKFGDLQHLNTGMVFSSLVCVLAPHSLK